MNDFEPEAIKDASRYLQNKLDLFKKGGVLAHKENVYKMKNKKETMFKRIVGSLFK